MTGLFYAEWSAPEGSDLDDPEALRAANPSMPYGRITPEFSLLERAAMTDDEYARERLGMFPDEDQAPQWLVITETDWAACKGKEPASKPGWLTGTVELAVEMPQDRTSASIVSAGTCTEGDYGIHLVTRCDPSQVVAAILELDGYDLVTVDPAGPAASLIPEMEGEGVAVRQCKYADLKVATSTAYDLAVAHRLHHRDDPDLNLAVSQASWRPAGDTRVVDRRAGVDVSPFTGGILALWGHLQVEEDTTSIYEERGFVKL